MSVEAFKQKKRSGERIAMLTAYDCFMASLLAEAQIDAILVGDTLGMVVLGYESTTPVTMDDMIRHSMAVRRGAPSAIVIGDMPYRSYDDPAAAVKNARRFIDEGGCNAVKLEGEAPNAAAAIMKEGIPALGHLGLTPQTAADFKVQGRDAKTAQEIIDASVRLEQAGCFAIVLECVPAELAAMITTRLSIPTIGIGAGPDCDGQILVLNDILGLFGRFSPKFVKRYADLGGLAKEAVLAYKEDVKNGCFPGKEHSFTIKKEELEKLR